MRKRTHEEYVSELAIKNPNVKVVDKYIDANTKILHRCLIHDIDWNITPSRALQGSGCEKCHNEKISISKTRPNEQFVDKLKSITQNIVPLEKYVNTKTPILFRCIEHDVEWKALPDNVLHGHGCHKCGKQKIGDKNKRSSKEYIEELKELNPNIIAIDTYIGANTPILHKCLIDGYEWKTAPSNILFGTGCPKCAGNIKLSHTEYVNKVSLINPNIEVIENYVNANTHIKHRCKKHNIVWKVIPYSILNGCGCVRCGMEKVGDINRKSHDQYVKELSKINSNIIVIDKYINSNTPILHQCLIDGYKWNVSPGNILSGHGCPRCNESQGERKICQYLDKHNIKYIREKRFNNCRDIRSLPFDFYLPEYNICIEYDGEQHNKSIEYFGGISSFNRLVKHDNIKNKYCVDNGISLLRIPYYKNVEEELNNFLFI